MHFEKAKNRGSIALVVTLINSILIGILFIDTLFPSWFGISIDFLLIISSLSIPIGLIAAIVSVRLYKTNLGVILIFANALFMIVPILFLYLISKGFCVIC